MKSVRHRYLHISSVNQANQVKTARAIKRFTREREARSPHPLLVYISPKKYSNRFRLEWWKSPYTSGTAHLSQSGKMISAGTGLRQNASRLVMRRRNQLIRRAMKAGTLLPWAPQRRGL